MKFYQVDFSHYNLNHRAGCTGETLLGTERKYIREDGKVEIMSGYMQQNAGKGQFLKSRLINGYDVFVEGKKAAFFKTAKEAKAAYAD